MAKKIDEHILSILSKVTIDDNKIFLTCGTLDRKDYQKVNEVLVEMGGKWNTKAKAHIFESDPTDKLEDVLLLGEISNKKQELQQFYTPNILAKRVVELAEIEPEYIVGEFSAGHGALVDAIPEDKKEIGNIVCCDIDEKNVEVLKNKGYRLVYHLDFLSQTFNETFRTQKFDRIILNPPFNNQNDVKHVYKAFGLLADDGILVSIMSPGFTFRDNKLSKEFKTLVETYGWYEENPEGSFKESGTNIKTVTVVLKK